MNMQALVDFFGANDFLPHGYCLTWNPALLWTTVTSDATMALAYGSYPIAVTYFVWKRQDLEYRWLYLAFFNGFILTCASTHLMSTITVWQPLYWLAAYTKALSAIVAVATVFAIWWVIPRALNLPSPAELRIQRNAAQYARSLIEASLDPLVTISPDGKITDVNRATEHITGRTRSELIGTDFSDYFTEADRAREGYRRVLREGSVTDYALSIRHQDGHVTDVLYNASLYRDEAGNVLGVFAAARDVTELRSSEERFRALAEATSEGVLIHEKGQIVEVNHQMEVILGRPRSELVSAAVLDFVAPASREVVSQRVQQPEDTRVEFAFARPDGAQVTVSGLAHTCVYRGRPMRVAAYHDITELKQREEELRSASLYARSLIEASVDPLVTISAEGKITDVNEATVQATGVPRKLLIGSDFSDYFTEPNKARAGYQEVFAKGFVTDYPLTLRHVTGRAKEVLYNASVYRDGKGEVAGVFAAAHDVTERKRAEQEMRSALLYARSLIEASLDPLVTISAEGKITDVNEATVQATGVPRRLLVGSDFSDYFTEPGKARSGYLEAFAKGFVTDYPLALRHVSGRIAEVLYNASVYRSEGGEVAGVFAAARDVTERKRAERELQEYREHLEELVKERTSALEAANKDLEGFAYSVSHDLRTPLRAIDGFSNILLRKYPDKLDDEGKRYLSVVRDNTKRMAQLIDDILAFSRMGRLGMNMAEVNMDALARTMLEELRHTFAGRDIAVEIKPLPACRGDQAMLRQVWINLLGNAIKFTRDKAGALVEVGGAVEGTEHIYYVRDNGAGFDMQYGDKLFGVFQRLHGVDEFEGTGIGLAIVKRIITRHGGRVWAEGKVNEGATFYFSLPA